MVEKKPVSVNWQTLFVFIPIVELWATYRIEKLRWHLLIFAVGFTIPQAVLSSIFTDLVNSSAYQTVDDPLSYLSDLLSSDLLIVIIAVEAIEAAMRIYLIRRWSGRWNLETRGGPGD